MDQKKIEQGVRLILEGIGEDLSREGLKNTPSRVAKMCEEIFEGIGHQPTVRANFTQEMGADNLIAVKDISFYSMCEHHFLPFFGKVHLYYVPQNNRVAGFSNLSEIVDIYARRLQIQERFTEQIADALVEALHPRGVLVMVEATQLCASMRGNHRKNLVTVTEAMRGSIPLQRILHLKTDKQ